MTIIYVTENNTKSYAETFQNEGWIKVQKIEDVSIDKNIIYKVNPIESFLGKSQLCDLTEFLGAKDKEVFDGNTFLAKIGEEINKHRYVYVGGDMVCSFLANDRIYKYISNMGNILSPCSIAIGWENVYYLTPCFKFTKKKNIDENDIDKLFDFHNISICQKLRVYKIHSNYDLCNFIIYKRRQQKIY